MLHGQRRTPGYAVTSKVTMLHGQRTLGYTVTSKLTMLHGQRRTLSYAVASILLASLAASSRRSLLANRRRLGAALGCGGWSPALHLLLLHLLHALSEKLGVVGGVLALLGGATALQRQTVPLALQHHRRDETLDLGRLRLLLLAWGEKGSGQGQARGQQLPGSGQRQTTAIGERLGTDERATATGERARRQLSGRGQQLVSYWGEDDSYWQCQGQKH